MSLIPLAKKISQTITGELGEQVKMILAYGSAARGDVTQFSDLDMLVITDSVSYHRSFVLKGQPVAVWSLTLDECKKMITTPSISWGVAITMFFHNIVLEGDRNVLDQLQSLYDSLDMQPFVRYCAETLVYFAEILGKVKNAARDNDLIYAKWASGDLANTAAGIVAMINKRYYLNQWGKHLPEILQCKILPNEFERDYRTLWLSSDFDELVDAINHLHTEFKRIIHELGAEIPQANTLQEAMRSR